MRFAVGHPN